MKRIMVFLLILILLLIQPVQATKFSAVKFDVWTTSFTYTVGQTTDVPVYIRGIGILKDNYTLTVKPIGEDERQIAIGNYGRIVELSSDEVQRIFIPMTPLYSDANGITFDIIVSSMIGTQKGCTLPPCSMTKRIMIKTGVASLPEFGIFGLLQIIIIAAVILAISKTRI